ncbi:MAG: RNA-guided endonuclease InsQ/TnpB family protein [Pseudomonadota bacterium]
MGAQRFIYNAKVKDDRYFRAFARKSLSHVGQYAPVDQTYSQYKTELTPFLKEVPSQVLRNAAFRWMEAYKRFFKKLGGRPNIKTKHGRQSVLLTSELFQLYQKENGNWFIHLGTKKFSIGNVKVNTHQAITLTPKMVVISIHAGRWSLSFNTEEIDSSTGEIIQFPEYTDVLAELAKYTESELSSVVVGVDRGVVLPACDSKSIISHKLLTENDKHIARNGLKRKRYQRKLARQTKGSSRYLRTKKKIAQLARYKSNCIANMTHQVSHKLTADKSTMVVALEELQVKNMTRSAKGNLTKPGRMVKQKSGLNRSILESGWGSLREKLRYKTFKRGKLLLFVPSKHTSQECSACGTIDKASRKSQSEFACNTCGVKINADLNASYVITKHAAFALYQYKQSGHGLSTRGVGKPRPQTPAELLVSHDVINSYHAQNVETGNRHLNLFTG